jgi:hypothetical protein
MDQSFHQRHGYVRKSRLGLVAWANEKSPLFALLSEIRPPAEWWGMGGAWYAPEVISAAREWIDKHKSAAA